MLKPKSSSTPYGARWRSSQPYIIFTAVLGLFSEVFLYAYTVPLLSYMVEVRLGLPSIQTQSIITVTLTIHGLTSMLSAPIIAHFTDKISNRRTPLLLALSACFLGTVLIAFCSSVYMLFTGRIIEAASGSACWILSFATLSDNISSKRIGSALGTAGAFVSAGILSGPVVAGGLLELAGYWAAWTAPLCLIGLGIIARLIMVEKHRKKDTSLPSEEDPLVPEAERTASTDEPPSSLAFYRIMLTKAHNLVGILNIVVFDGILTSFDTTLPLHLQRHFNWSPLSIGLIFLGFQIPGMILGPIVGHVRDRVGLRVPTSIGWALMAVCLIILGYPGSRFEPSNSMIDGQAIFIAAVTAVGIVAPLVRGVGTLHLLGVSKQIEIEYPSLFGPNGASSRVFSLDEVATNFGMMTGPLVAGTIVEVFNFQWTMVSWSVLSLAIGVFSSIVLPRGSENKQETSTD